MRWLPLFLPLLWCVLSESFRPADWVTGIVLGAVAWLLGGVLLPARSAPDRLRPLRLFPVFLRALVGMWAAMPGLLPLVISGQAHATETVVPIRLRHPLTRLVLCGAITMSPGTISVRFSGGMLHILTLVPARKPMRTPASIEALRLQDLLLRVEGGS